MSVLHEAPERDDAARAAWTGFEESYGYPPTGVFSAPGRVNIIGEHVDYQGGVCVPMAISHRCFVAAALTESNVLRVRSAQAADAVDVDVDALEPGCLDGWGAYVAGVVWALREHRPAHEPGGIDIFVDGQVPLGAGLSSSAALECAVAQALESLCGLGTSPHERIRACIAAETTFVGAPTGGLDQTASVLASEGHALVLDCRDFSTTAIPWDLAEHALALLICDTRATHALVGGEYGDRRAQAQSAARTLGVEVLREVDPKQREKALEALSEPVIRARARHIFSEIERAERFSELLMAGSVRESLTDIGALMNASHDSLREDYEVTVAELDTAVDAARAAGAYGARMTGGGFGGSMIALVQADRVEFTARAILDAFHARGFAPPAFFVANPGPGAGVDIWEVADANQS